MDNSDFCIDQLFLTYAWFAIKPPVGVAAGRGNSTSKAPSLTYFMKYASKHVGALTCRHVQPIPVAHLRNVWQQSTGRQMISKNRYFSDSLVDIIVGNRFTKGLFQNNLTNFIPSR